MKDDTYFKEAEKAIMGVLKEWRPKLLAELGTVEYELKTDASVVTSLDRDIEMDIKNALKKLDPSVGFLGEEHGQEGSTEHYWLLDPIDGTELFIRGMNGCRNLFCFMSDGEAKFALLYMFVTDVLFIARAGKGTTRNGQPISIKYRPLERCWIDSSMKLLDKEVYAAYCRIRPHIGGIVTMRNFSNFLDGFTDGYIGMNDDGGPWDYAPRALLFIEAGARVTNIGSDTYDWGTGNMLAAHPDNFEQLQKLLSPQA